MRPPVHAPYPTSHPSDILHADLDTADVCVNVSSVSSARCAICVATSSMYLWLPRSALPNERNTVTRVRGVFLLTVADSRCVPLLVTTVPAERCKSVFGHLSHNAHLNSSGFDPVMKKPGTEGDVVFAGVSKECLQTQWHITWSV
jgi:hypothetical protein